MMRTAVAFQDVSYAYPDGTAALYAVSFRIAEGESVAVIGANGAGKSTLLHHLNGVLSAREGTVTIGGAVVSRDTLPAVRRAVGMVFQDPDDQLFMPTVLEDVAFGPLHAGLSAEEAERAAEEALTRVGIGHLRERPPYRLSAGEKRAAAIATVLALNPDILVLDEPSSNLDPRGRRRLIGLLHSLNQTRLVATHDLELVLEVCSRVLVLDGGRVVADGPAAEILNQEPLMLAHGLERPHSLRHRHPHP